MDGLTKRESIGIGIGIVLAAILTAWGCYWLVNNVIANRDDPMIKQGGIKPEQRSPAKPSTK